MTIEPSNCMACNCIEHAAVTTAIKAMAITSPEVGCASSFRNARSLALVKSRNPFAVPVITAVPEFSDQNDSA